MLRVGVGNDWLAVIGQAPVSLLTMTLLSIVGSRLAARGTHHNA